jgi:putative Holliday junction resolvase
MAVILGIDYGRKRIGLAASDVGGKIAAPLAVIDATDRLRAIREIARIAAQHQAAEAVVGMPRSLDGTLGPMAKETEAFVAELKAALKIPVVTFDERLSTAQAERAMIDADMSRAKRKERVDKVAAQITLQSYLDSRSKKDG